MHSSMWSNHHHHSNNTSNTDRSSRHHRSKNIPEDGVSLLDPDLVIRPAAPAATSWKKSMIRRRPSWYRSSNSSNGSSSNNNMHSSSHSRSGCMSYHELKPNKVVPKGKKGDDPLRDETASSSGGASEMDHRLNSSNSNNRNNNKITKIEILQIVGSKTTKQAQEKRLKKKKKPPVQFQAALTVAQTQMNWAILEGSDLPMAERLDASGSSPSTKDSTTSVPLSPPSVYSRTPSQYTIEEPSSSLHPGQHGQSFLGTELQLRTNRVGRIHLYSLDNNNDNDDDDDDDQSQSRVPENNNNNNNNNSNSSTDLDDISLLSDITDDPQHARLAVTAAPLQVVTHAPPVRNSRSLLRGRAPLVRSRSVDSVRLSI